MTLHWNGQKVLADIGSATAENLLAAAVFFQTTHKRRLSKPAADKRQGRRNRRRTYVASLPGEYPRLRTGHGRGGHTFEPTTKAGVIAANYTIRLGYLRNVFYMAVLETRQKRLGLMQTLRDTLPQLRALAGKKKVK